MKQLLFLVIIHTFCGRFCILGVVGLETVPNSVDNIADTTNLHTDIVKRANTAFKRLPGWGVYYGKRSFEAPQSAQSDNDNVNEQIRENGELDLEIVKQENGISDVDKNDNGRFEKFLNEWKFLDAPTKRANLKRLQTWMSTYGKRSLLLNKSNGYSSTDSVSSTENDESYNWKQAYSSFDFDNKYDKRSQSLATSDKRDPKWSAIYGKRMPGWGATYGKRVPGWGATYGKRMPGWGVTYGKRASGWDFTQDKLVPGWSATVDKRVPGWGATYGKRDAEILQEVDKRAPMWSATYGKRAPGWYAMYGKRSNAWNAFYGKRVPGWGATYGKRVVESDSDNTYNHQETQLNEEVLRKSEGKRTQAWQAFYGR
ncbi:uncharacterized protein LOC128231914 [Mya arenaria]|uniref:uncharacterized protein LOC128231914 n=1 Tax=Mya arenaria TaxID=6604 RepID=UPI0022E4E3A9|nr:uncharacterized protein LOC128231914 [Mya arenaria]